LDCLFIAAGIHGVDAVRDGRADPGLVAGLLAAEGLSATYAMAELKG
jgi:hypothetical protein